MLIPSCRVASDYFNDEEMAAFKKPSKKGKKKKIRKKLLKVCFSYFLKFIVTVNN